MAMQAGMGLSCILLLLGAVYTGMIVLRNGRLSDILDELQDLVKELEKSPEESRADFDIANAHTLCKGCSCVSGLRKCYKMHSFNAWSLSSTKSSSCNQGMDCYAWSSEGKGELKGVCISLDCLLTRMLR